MASRIEDYGLIGNTRTAALVSRHGSIDWFGGPRFDSDACFAALIGYDEHGRWQIRPTVAVHETKQRYRGDTMILETEFFCDSGAVRIIDFMPMGHGEEDSRCDLVRVIEGLQGEVPVEMLLDVRFGYGKDTPWVTPTDGGMQFTAGPDTLVFRGQIDIRGEGSRVSAYVNVKQGDRIPLQLVLHPSHEPTPQPLAAEDVLSATESFWRDWAGRCTCEGQLRELVMRSLLSLKAMTYAPTGAIVAAPTTSLPESVGGVRNWDYRFCWMRDASLTIDALLMGGYLDEARGFTDWVMRAAAGDPAEMQIMYDIMGARRLTEFELPWLPGYEGSRPVRVGNAASGQFQLDVYGELLAALYAGRKMGLAARHDTWLPLRKLLAFLETAWQREDDGIWEVRGGRRHFTHSKIMAWVAIDRAARSIEELGVGGDEARAMVPHLHALRERIHSEVCDRGFNPRVGAFTQSYGSEALDASVLVMTHFGFLPASDARVKGTVAAIEKHLVRDGFVLRYSTDTGNDGLPGTEGAFLACSFWLADNYAFAGRVDEAERLFERLLSLRNHLGLLSEEYEPTLQRQIGNFPQAFSHLALITTARIIDAMRHQQAHAPLRGEGIVEIMH